MFCLGAISILSAQAADEVAGQIVSVSGKVLARNEKSKTTQLTLLKSGDKLYEGSVVNTGAGGTAKLLMSDRTIIDLGPSSVFKVNEFKLKQVTNRTVEMELEQGQMRASVNKAVPDPQGKFSVKTRAATMGVRGTEFLVKTPPIPPTGGPPPPAQITVVKGLVAVADNGGPKTGGNPVMLSAGMQLQKDSTTSGSATTTPTQLSASQITAVKTESTVKDSTFISNVTFDSKSSADSKDSGNSSGDGKSGGDSKTADSGQKSDSKGDSKTETKPEGKAESKAEPKGNQTLNQVSANVSEQVKVEIKAAPPPPPPVQGVFTPVKPPSVTVDTISIKNGNARIQVNFTP